MNIALNLPTYRFKIKQGEQIFDRIRKKYVALTPEEWVRQHVVEFLIREKACPSGLLGVEVSLPYWGMRQRADIVVFNKQAKPLLIVECKAATVKLTNKTFEQIARYTIGQDIDYLIVTNGLKHYCLQKQNGKYEFLDEIPNYDSMLNADF